MPTLKELLEISSARHLHLCSRQVWCRACAGGSYFKLSPGWFKIALFTRRNAQFSTVGIMLSEVYMPQEAVRSIEA